MSSLCLPLRQTCRYPKSPHLVPNGIDLPRGSNTSKSSTIPSALLLARTQERIFVSFPPDTSSTSPEKLSWGFINIVSNPKYFWKNARDRSKSVTLIPTQRTPPNLFCAGTFFPETNSITFPSASLQYTK